MGPRLELKYGLVAEADRLSTSADAMLVTEPATGSKVRSKGNLYLVVSSARIGGRARDAAALVADTVRREYYYDESAGVPICLEKAVRSANRKLRGSREGGGLPPGSLGIAIAVIRNNELYVATIGSAEAYLVRAARLLVPDHTQQPGLPADDALRVEVWRGEIAVGDSLLLVSRNLTEVVGTEELKNAVVTLHPQSAVEHLHHLFVAAGGDGPDAVLAVEATELVSARGDRRLAPVSGGTDAFGEMPGGPIPGGDQVAGAAAAVTGAFSGAADSVTGAFGHAVDRILDLMPRRTRSARGVASQVSRRESQRRAAFALLGLLGVVLVLGLAIWLLPRGREAAVSSTSSGEQSFLTAQTTADKGGRLLIGDPVQATGLLRQAWTDLQHATTSGIPRSRTAPLEATIRAGLDSLYLNAAPRTSTLYSFSDPQDIKAMTVGPRGDVYYIGPASDGTGSSVWRLNDKGTKVYEIIKTGDGRGEGIATPRLLRAQGTGQSDDLLVVDARGDLWRWRQYDDKTNGNLATKRIPGQQVWGSDVLDISTLTVSALRGTYNLYVLDPSLDQILKYSPTLDGNQFSSAVDNYLSTADESVADYLRLYVDSYVYTLTASNVVKHSSGRPQSYSLATPPDDGDLRPGHTYRLIDGTGLPASGRLYVYDEKWDRILVFLKSDGSYVEQWSTKGAGLPSMADIRGMFVTQPATQRGQSQAPGARVTWATPDGIFKSTLAAATVAAPAASPAPGASDAPALTRTPKPTKQPG